MPTQDGQITITVGAVRDASISRVFKSIREDAKRVGTHMRRALSMRKVVTDVAKYRDALRALDGDVAHFKDNQRRMTDSVTENTRKQTQTLKRSLKEQEDAQRRHSNHTRSIHARDAASARRRAREEERGMRRFGRIVSHRTTRFLTPNAPIGSFAGRHALGVARGIGLNLSPEIHLANIAEQQTAARRLSTQAYIKGADGAAGVRVDPTALRGEMRELVKQYGVSGGTSALLGAGQAFVGQRGNLAGFRALAPELTKRMVAYDLEGEGVGLMAAKIESALANQSSFADEGKRNNAVLKVMDVLLQQGKVGSVEGENLVKQLPKLSGIAGDFGGDITKNIAELMTVMQLAERGPAPNSATAGTYAANLALGLTKNAGKLKDIAGVETFNDDGSKRAISDIIIDTIAATAEKRTVKVRGKGNVEMNQAQQLQSIFANKREFLALQEFITVFKGAGGGTKGIDALRSEFDKFSGASVTKQVEEDLAKAQEDITNKTEKMNARFEEVSERLAHRLVPTLEKLEEPLVTLANKLADLTTWVVDNPKQAIAAAIGASIARAGLETVLRVGVEKMFQGGAQLVSRLVTAMFAGQASAAAATAGAGTGAGAAATAGWGALLGTTATAIAGAILAGPWSNEKEGERQAEVDRSRGFDPDAARNAIEFEDPIALQSALDSARAASDVAQRNVDATQQAIRTHGANENLERTLTRNTERLDQSNVAIQQLTATMQSLQLNIGLSGTTDRSAN